MDATYFTGQVASRNRNEILVPYEPEPRITEKWCYRCRRFKPYGEFYRKALKFDGYSDECKLCDKAVRRESWNKKNA